MANVNELHKGSLYMLKLDDGTENLVLCATSIDPSIAMDTSEVESCRGDATSTGGTWKKYIPGDKSAEIAVEGFVKMSNDWQIVRFFKAIDEETLLDFELYPADPATPSTPLSGGAVFSGKCWVTALSYSTPQNEVVSYSCTLVVDGRPTMIKQAP